MAFDAQKHTNTVYGPLTIFDEVLWPGLICDHSERLPTSTTRQLEPLHQI